MSSDSTPLTLYVDNVNQLMHFMDNLENLLIVLDAIRTTAYCPKIMISCTNGIHGYALNLKEHLHYQLAQNGKDSDVELNPRPCNFDEAIKVIPYGIHIVYTPNIYIQNIARMSPYGELLKSLKNNIFFVNLEKELLLNLN